MCLCDYLVFVCFVLCCVLIGAMLLLAFLFKMYIDVKAEVNTLQMILKEL